VEIALIVLAGLLIILGVYKLPVLIGLGVFGVVGSSVIGFSVYEWTNSMYLLDWTYSLLVSIIVFGQLS
jgi:hypothetical protein